MMNTIIYIYLIYVAIKGLQVKNQEERGGKFLVVGLELQ